MASFSDTYSMIFKKGSIILFLGICIIMSGTGVVFLGPEKGFLILFVVLGVCVAVGSIVNYIFGFYAAMTLSFFIFFISRFFNDEYPLGSAIDILIMSSFAGLLLQKVIKKETFLFNSKHIITYAYLLYTLFLILEIFNPAMDSLEGWFFVIRKYLLFLMTYFMALNLFSTFKRVKFFFKYWLLLSFIAGVYGCYQEWFGFLPFEENWINSNPARAGLYLLVTGLSRKFSTFSDPAAYGIIMAATFVIGLILLLYTKKIKQKIFLTIACVFILLGVAYSGTRTAYFIIAAGMVVYIVMTITKRNTMIFACLFVLAFATIMFAPIYGNNTINRIRSTFEFSDEASLKVRDENRNFIQPYIYQHPMGGGLATSGVQGLTYNPNHFLAGFPPDSGFVKTAIETGWIGFFLQCMLYFIILQAGAHSFYNTYKKGLRVFCLCAVVCSFAFILGQFGQVAIGQIPGSFLFYSCLALIVKSKYLYQQIKNNSI